MVWADLGQWMVVDNELFAFMHLLGEGRSVRDAILVHSRRTTKSFQIIEKEALSIISQLNARGVLNLPGVVSPKKSGSLKIANVTTNLTNKCNLRCSFCYNAERSSEEMDVDRLMDRVAEHGHNVFDANASFIILGGEPFLFPQRLLRAVDRANQIFTSLPTMVSSNGTLLDAHVVAELARRRVEIQVSVDSHDPASHDGSRGSGVFERAIRGIELLVEAGVYTIISMVYTKRNFTEFERFLDMATDLGVNEARFIPLRLIGKGKDGTAQRPNQAEAFESFLQMLGRRPEFRKLLLRDYFSIQSAIANCSMNNISCGVGRRVIFVDADGTVYPCPNHTDPQFRCGDLRDASLSEIWNSSEVLKNIRNEWQVSRYDLCSGCLVKRWCAGDCRGEVFSLTGNHLGPSPHCEQIKANFLKLFWLIADGDMRVALKDSSQAHGFSSRMRAC